MRTRISWSLVSLLMLLPVSSKAQTAAEHFVVEYGGTGEVLASAVEALGGTVARSHPQIGVANVSGLSDEAAAELQGWPGVQRVTRDLEIQWVPGFEAVIGRAQVTPGAASHNDPVDALFFDLQWNLRQVEAPAAWEIEQGEPGVRVAILDTGISPTHVDLAGRYDLDPDASTSFVDDEPFVEDLNFHGTCVSGFVSTNNIGIAGMAPHVTLIGVKVLDRFGTGSFADLIAGILWAADVADADIINLSLGAYVPRNSAGPLIGALARAVNYAEARGALVTAAAGGQSADLDHDGNFVFIPAESGTAMAVSATAPVNQQNFDRLAGYSNLGVSAVDVAAPGGELAPGGVLSDLVLCPAAPPVVGGSTSSYFFVGGTSFSAPLVAGIAGLIDSMSDGNRNGGQLRSKIERTADDLGEPGVDPVYSHGRVNAYRALQ